MTARPRPLLSSHPNFRDIGGYPASGGRRVRSGVVYRAGYLADLTEEDEATLAGFGIRTVCDLRTSLECEVHPNVWSGHDEVEVHSLGLTDRGMRATGDSVTTIRKYGITEVTEEHVQDAYRRMVDSHADAFGRILALCGDPSRHAVVVHCSAGKDRTGLAIALLLTVLGVERTTVLDDYEASNELFSEQAEAEARPRLVEAGLDPEPLRLYFAAPRSALEAAFAHVEATWGSVEGFLTERAGVSPAHLEAVRDALLEDAS